MSLWTPVEARPAEALSRAIADNLAAIETVADPAASARLIATYRAEIRACADELSARWKTGDRRAIFACAALATAQGLDMRDVEACPDCAEPMGCPPLGDPRGDYVHVLVAPPSCWLAHNRQEPTR